MWDIYVTHHDEKGQRMTFRWNERPVETRDLEWFIQDTQIFAHVFKTNKGIEIRKHRD